MHMALLIWAVWEVTKITKLTVSSPDCKLITDNVPVLLAGRGFFYKSFKLKNLHYDQETQKVNRFAL